MMEGISGEAASLAGHLKLSNLCWIYDNNKITIEGNTDWPSAKTSPRASSATAGTSPASATPTTSTCSARAFHTFENTHDRPTLIIVDSHIAWGAPNKQDTHAAHGEPLGEEEIRLTKRVYGWPEDAQFLVPDGVREHFQEGIGKRGHELREAWFARLKDYKAKYPELADQLERMQHRELPANWDKGLTPFPTDAKGKAGRDASGKVLNVLAQECPVAPGRRGGPRAFDQDPADVSGGRRLLREELPRAQLPLRHPRTRDGGDPQRHVPVEAAPYGSGFLIFSDYGKAPIRLAAIMEIPVIYIFTHDSIGVGEDGPTHQPIEQLASLRAVPGLMVIRPADANEVLEAWKLIMQLQHEPVALILTRQALPTLDRDEICLGRWLAARRLCPRRRSGRQAGRAAAGNRQRSVALHRSL